MSIGQISVVAPGVGKVASPPKKKKKKSCPTTLLRVKSRKMGIFLYKVVKTDDVLMVLPPLINIKVLSLKGTSAEIFGK